MTRKGIGGHQSARSKTDTWVTPRHILAALGEFDLDPCGAPGRPWDCAKRTITLPEDGLAAAWTGRVWLNPPYSDVGAWMRKMKANHHGTALVFARTETTWFHDYVFDAATAILFLRGRLHFHHADGRRADMNAGAPSCLVAYGDSDADRLGAADIDGRFLWL